MEFIFYKEQQIRKNILKKLNSMPSTVVQKTKTDPLQWSESKGLK